MDLSLLPALCGIAALAGLTQGFAGFGSTLVAMPLLVGLLGMRTAVPVGCMMALSINIMLLPKLRRGIRFRDLRPLFLGAAPGMAIGAVLFSDAPEGALKALLGAAILALTLQQMRAPRPQRPPAEVWGAAAGVVAGCTAVCIGVDGPPVVAWMSRMPWRRDALRATLTFYFLLAGCCVVFVKTLQGQVTPQVVALYALSLPALAVGLWAGAACCGRAGDALFRRVLLVMLAAAGAAMLWQGGMGLVAQG